MLKKIILLPLAVLICFSLNAWDWHDPAGSYTYDIYNTYVERPWLLPPSEYYWYSEKAKPAPAQNTYNTYNTDNTYNTYNYKNIPPKVDPVISPPAVVLPPTSLAPGESGGSYRFQDLDLSGNPLISGYQGLAWGTPISQFRSCFPDAEEVTVPDNAYPRVRSFAQHSVGNGIQSRQFLFLDGQLYEVYVHYGYVTESIAAEMQNILARRYGQPFNTIERTDRFSSGRYDIVDTYMGNNREMLAVLTICAVYDSNNTFQGKVMTCLFSNPQIRTQ